MASIRQIMERLDLGINVLRSKVESLNQYQEVLMAEVGLKSDQVVSMHEAWRSRELRYTLKRLDALMTMRQENEQQSLNRLKEQFQRPEVAKSADIIVGPEHQARRNRTCKGKKFKNKPREARRPKVVEKKSKKNQKPASGKQPQHGKKRGNQRQAA